MEQSYQASALSVNVSSENVLKRLADISLVIFAAPFFAPILLITAFFIKLEDGGPVFFKQKRVGKDGKEFDFYKFRSMKVNAQKMKNQLLSQNESKQGVTFKMKRDPRITKIGSFIRKFSLDELPQLLNVLKGDMSLVGPRPAVPREVALYNSRDKLRLAVTPGITCFWQVSGRSDIPFKEQVELDIKYIKESSLMTDFTILLKTIPAVITAKGAY